MWAPKPGLTHLSPVFRQGTYIGTAPDYMKDMFKFVTDVSHRQTRFVDNSKLYLPTGNHLKVFTDSFQYAANAVWNKLPVHVRDAESTPAYYYYYYIITIVNMCYMLG